MASLKEILDRANAKRTASAPKPSNYVNTSYDSNNSFNGADPRLSEVTQHVPIDNSSGLFTGSVNRDSNGVPIITPYSTVEDHIYSQKYQAAQHNTILPADITPTYPNPDFPASLIEGDLNKDPEGIKFDTNPFYQKLARKALDENFKTTLKEPEQYPGWQAFLPDINAYSLIGDPRWTLGYAMRGIFQWWWPKMQIYTDFLSNQGLIIQDKFICDADGNQIAENTADNLTTILQSSMAPGAEIPKPPTFEEIQKEFERQKEEAFNKHAQAFADYIRKTFLDKQFFVESYYFHPMRLFVLKSYKLNYKGGLIETKYTKYYSDQIDFVINKLKIPIQQINQQGFSIHLKEGNLLEDIGKPIPDYISLVKKVQID